MGKTFMQEVVMRMNLLGKHHGKAQLWGMVVALGLALTSPANGPGAWAASHREAPLIALDPTADITDFYGFRSWVNRDRVVFMGIHLKRDTFILQ
jgi:hypothetical protein